MEEARQIFINELAQEHKGNLSWRLYVTDGNTEFNTFDLEGESDMDKYRLSILNKNH